MTSADCSLAWMFPLQKAVYLSNGTRGFFLDTELSREEILKRKVAFTSCFEQDYSILFKQKANKLISTQQPCLPFSGEKQVLKMAMKNKIYIVKWEDVFCCSLVE